MIDILRIAREFAHNALSSWNDEILFGGCCVRGRNHTPTFV
jgi:hypothetical protein